MRTQVSLVVCGLVLVGLFYARAYAQPHFEVGLTMGAGIAIGDGPGMMLPLLLKGVDLTAEQETQVREIMAAQRQTLRTHFEQLRTAHEEMANKLLTPGEVKEDDFTPQLQRITQLREQLMREGLTVMLAVRKVLTSEQLAKAVQIKDRMQALHNEMRGLLHEKGAASGPEESEGGVIFFEHP
jgi:Spy/CpxP family protein refolding chaperone